MHNQQRAAAPAGGFKGVHVCVLCPDHLICHRCSWGRIWQHYLDCFDNHAEQNIAIPFFRELVSSMCHQDDEKKSQEETIIAWQVTAGWAAGRTLSTRTYYHHHNTITTNDTTNTTIISSKKQHQRAGYGVCVLRLKIKMPLWLSIWLQGSDTKF